VSPLTSRIGAAGLVLLLVTGLGACTTAPDLPTLETTATPAVTGADAVAQAFFGCMSSADVPVQLKANSSGRLYVGFTDYHWAFRFNKTDNIPTMLWTNDTPNAADRQAAYDELARLNTDDPSSQLVIDGVDVSAAYANCLAQTGYSEVAAESADPPVDPAALARQVAANNEWAACARENGFPLVADSVAPATEGDYPMVVLPGTITAGQLRQLLATCPNWTADKQADIDAWRAGNPVAVDLPDDIAPDPAITFDVPDNLKFPDLAGTPSPEEQDEIARVDELYAILVEQAGTYRADHPNDTGGAVYADSRHR
jgi:hypothetical protein